MDDCGYIVTKRKSTIRVSRGCSLVGMLWMRTIDRPSRRPEVVATMDVKKFLEECSIHVEVDWRDIITASAVHHLTSGFLSDTI